MSELWHTIRAVRPALEKDIDTQAHAQADAVLERLGDRAVVADADELGVATDRARADLLDFLLSEETVGKVARAVDVAEVDRQVLAFDLRQASGPLRIDPPEQVTELRTGFLVTMAGLGALAGMLFGSWLFLLMGVGSEGVHVGRMIGALIGPALFVAMGMALARRDRLRRVIQAVLGAMAVGIGVSELMTWVNPLGTLWGMVRGREGVSSRLKLLFLFGALAVVLSFAKPVRKTKIEQLRRALVARIRAWLGLHVDLLALLVAMQDGRPVPELKPAEPAPAINSAAVLAALQKLARAGSDEQRAAVAEEVIQECENAGLAFSRAGRSEGVFTESLRMAYNVIGLIQEGDAYRELEPPIREGDRVVAKGRLTRKRA